MSGKKRTGPRADFGKLCPVLPVHEFAGKKLQDAACQTNEPADYTTAVKQVAAPYLALLPLYEQDVAAPPAALVQAMSVVQAGPARTALEKAARVNLFVNSSIAYTSDMDVHGKADYWQRPSETLHRRTGDCEDMALLKMALLEKAGFPREKMWLANGILNNSPVLNGRTVGHSTLVVELEGRPFVLDNFYKANEPGLNSLVPLDEFYNRARFTPVAMLNPLEVLGTEHATLKSELSNLLPPPPAVKRPPSLQ